MACAFASWIYDGHCNLITMPSTTILFTVLLCVVVVPDDSQLSSGDNNNTLEPMSENWITTCIEENDSTVFHSHK
jgi:hypothetical protein